ncbi:CRISPR-associated endonuclease Cas2 [Candidatus Poriferisodalis sp.]|uniref:CRISPR-associated endonuclease Cas2 n=1 Tax=Candidatus Poriferisodalis sp. TaxID=3101277 RepID=UPI003B594A98
MNEYSGYRFMWTIVMFDLPVTTKPQRRRATKFRNELLDLGFEMAQFSVYMKFCGSRSAVDALAYRVHHKVPPEGHVSILSLTDKQYGQMQVFNGGAREHRDTERNQLLLF